MRPITSPKGARSADLLGKQYAINYSEGGSMYYWLNVFGEVEHSDIELSWAKELKESGNYFLSEAEAVLMRMKIREVLNAGKEKDNLGKDK